MPLPPAFDVVSAREWGTFGASIIAALAAVIAAAAPFILDSRRRREIAQRTSSKWTLWLIPHVDGNTAGVVLKNTDAEPGHSIKMIEVVSPRGARIAEEPAAGYIHKPVAECDWAQRLTPAAEHGGAFISQGVDFRFVVHPRSTRNSSSRLRLTIRLSSEENSSTRLQTRLTVTSQEITLTASKVAKPA